MYSGFFLIKPTDALISQTYFVKKLYLFRAVPLPIIRGFQLYNRHCWWICSWVSTVLLCIFCYTILSPLFCTIFLCCFYTDMLPLPVRHWRILRSCDRAS